MTLANLYALAPFFACGTYISEGVCLWALSFACFSDRKARQSVVKYISIFADAPCVPCRILRLICNSESDESTVMRTAQRSGYRRR